MKEIIFLVTLLGAAITVFAQNVGIGTSNPTAGLQVAAGKDVIFGNDMAVAGNKLYWVSSKNAFRCGYVNPALTIGTYSTAMGFDNTAGGSYSTAMGYGCTSGNFSIAAGDNCTASGDYSVAMGFHTTAPGSVSSALGNNSLASGDHSTAIGFYNTANGNFATAIGRLNVASGNSSTAMGSYVNTNGLTGGFMIGDDDPHNEGITYAGVANQFVARFANGYYLLTSGDNNRFGVQIGPGGNAWVSICDKTQKENFEELNSERILTKLSAITYTSWNYKGQSSKTCRHYGIMAQDFYTAFGKDSFGSIGCDTLVNPVDMLGIAYSAIQALELRTQKISEQQQQIAFLQKENAGLKARLEKLEKIVMNK